MGITELIDKVLDNIVFKIILTIDAIISVGAFLVENKTILVEVVFYATAAILIISALLLAWRYHSFVVATKNNEELTTKIRLLEENIHSGLKYTKNEVVVTLYKKGRRYSFDFTKEYEIISDTVPSWYTAQFYANKILDDKINSKQYYTDHEIKWSKLGMKATISYRPPDSDSYIDAGEVEINNITDNSNYIPFNIQYTTLEDGRTLDIKKGTRVVLKYSYNISCDLWGSYLNRSISYFGEHTTVKLRRKAKKDLKVKVSKLSSDGKPVDLSPYDCKDYEEDGFFVKEIHLEPFPFARYRIWWNSQGFFGNDTTTHDTADCSQLTSY